MTAKVLFILISIPFGYRDVLGEYGATCTDGTELSLILSASNGYKLYKIVSTGDDMETELLLSSGNVSFDRHGILLSEDNSQKKLGLKTMQDEMLQVVSVGEVYFGGLRLDKTIFYCFSGYFDNGKVRFSGGWCKGKKCGSWYYYDRMGNLEKKNCFD